MMRVAVGKAPGKVLLMGEHSVVYGHPAIAIPLRSVSARAEVEFTHGGRVEIVAPELGEQLCDSGSRDSRLSPLLKLISSVQELFGEMEQGLRVKLHSTVPLGRGMGSGAAIAVAIVRGICQALDRRLNNEQIAELAMISEKEYHGTPSGVDAAVISRDEPIYFVRDKPMQGIELGGNCYHFIVADTGVEALTAGVVEGVRKARESDRARYDSYFWELGSMASVAREVLRNGSPEELGLCMNHAHKVLQLMGVSCDELDRLVGAALESGALGAKLSGAGRGGAMIALVKDDADIPTLESKLGLAGAVNVYTTVLGNGS